MSLTAYLGRYTSFISFIFFFAAFGFNSYAQYCIPVVTGTVSNVGITNVSFSNLNSPTATQQGYVSYAALDTATVIRGSTYGLSVTHGDQMRSRVWIDWNQDLDFADAGELVFDFNEMFAISPVYTKTQPVLVPVTAVLGYTRMRVSGISGQFTQADTCNNPNGDVEDYIVEIVEQNMVYDSVTTQQYTYNCLTPGDKRKILLGFNINTTGHLSPLTLNSVDINTTGSTNATADLLNAELWYTAGSSLPATTVLAGSFAAIPGGVFTINTSAMQLQAGYNYFWLSFDISGTATPGNFIDAGCNAVTVNLINYIPSNPNPAGTQVINAKMLRTPDMRRTHVWYFGNGGGIDFNCNPPRLLIDGDASASFEGCATISDTNGEILFYCNGQEVYNRYHQVLPNGSGLSGHYSSSQSSIFIPQPGNDSIFYLFTVGREAGIMPVGSNQQSNHTGLRYSIINKNLNGGMGDVVTGMKNILLIPQVEEKVTATKHCNNEDIWVVGKQYNSTNFYSYRISSSGIIDTVISAVGVVGTGVHGHMKLSPNGKMLAVANYSSSNAYLYEFNRMNGTLCNRVNLSAPQCYGVSFSSDNSRLYFTQWFSNKIFQFSQLTGSAAVINASKTTITDVTSNLGDMELAPDGKIYVARTSGPTSFPPTGPSPYDTLGIINFPNTSGAGCNYQPQGFWLGGTKHCSNGLPNFLQKYLIDTTYIYPVAVNQFTYTPACFPDTVFFNNNSIAYSSCPVWKWNFGDPASGSADSSLLQNPGHHLFSSQGTFTVSLYLADECDTDTTYQVIDNRVPTLVLSPDTSYCAGGSVQLTASGAANFLWSPSAGLSSGTGNSVIANPSGNTTYTVIASNSSTCADTSFVTININQLPVLAASADTTVCSGASVVLSVSGAVNYSWSPSSGISAITGASVTANPASPSTYTITGTDVNGCSDTVTIGINVNPSPSVSVSGNPSICAGDSAYLTASGALTYNWQPSTGLSSSTSASVVSTVAIPTTYTVLGTNASGCSDTAIVSVSVNATPVAALSDDTTICLGGTAALVAAGGSNYLWNQSATTSSISVSPLLNSLYSVTVYNGPCTDTASVNVFVVQPPVIQTGGNITIVPGGSAIISAGGGTGYSWSPAGGLSCTDCSSPTASPVSTTRYYVIVTDGNGCTSKDSVLVEVDNTTCGNYFLPNAFSPNADGENDILYVYGNCVNYLNLVIYNRWGEIMFETSDIKIGWDGTYKGKPLTTAVFYYALNLETTTESVFRKGTIQLIR